MIRIIIITLCFSACLGLKAQTCCQESLPSCFDDCDATWNEITKTVTLPQTEFDDCQISVTYCYQVCPPTDEDVTHETRWTICNVAIFPGPGGCTDCDNLINYLKNGNDYIDYVRWNAFKLDLIRVITYDNFEDHLQFLIDNNQEELVECPNYHSKTTYAESSCAQLCFVTTAGNSYIHKLDCEDSYCCGLTIKYCYDAENDEIVIEETKYGDEGPCYATPAPYYLYTIEDCPDGEDVSITPYCEDQCNYILNE